MKNSHLESILADQNATVEQKIDCLKLLKVVSSNLADPEKCTDQKYRLLKTSNEKVAKKLLVFSSAVDFLFSLGFTKDSSTDDDGGAVHDAFRITADRTVDPAAMQTALLQVTTALASIVESPSPSPSSSATTTKHAHTTTNHKPVVKERLSEKQKARLLLAKKEAEEKKMDRHHRAKNLKALKEDEYARRNDPNWKSGVSSACSKAGSSISTFRDKYGEN